ncbi:hypothetical protein K8Z61_18605 [Nocardioides sp. TRM66260-LWL]|uniref:hypothetical protein n=1 Tax=Nocardioides sp. TRM66260-LWL TaxID=2874478 RepID=UPI001CC5B809|nr:hypothetical protein [Nocardioides sp. TRM66260-LWL]MBZ5736507.1 hypothetical protein [Nocardioides sp. TRM66260-LWL]
MRAALIGPGGDVVNVIALPDTWDPASPGAWAPPDWQTIKPLPADSPVAPGWTLTRTGQWRGPTDPADQADPVAALYARIAELEAAVASLTAQQNEGATP